MVKKVKGLKVVSREMLNKFKFTDDGASFFGSSLTDIHSIKGSANTTSVQVEGSVTLENRISDALFGVPQLAGVDTDELQHLVDNAADYEGFIVYLTSVSEVAPFAQEEKFYFCENGVWHPSPFASAEGVAIVDTDEDGVPDDQDAFPNDPAETADTDSDGVGDNADAFPADASETTDTDLDGVGDNADAFPTDASETADSDGDGVGDNTDLAPNNPLLTDVTPVADGMTDTLTFNYECTFHHHPSSWNTNWEEYYQPFAAILRKDLVLSYGNETINPINVHTLFLPTGKAGDGAFYETYNQDNYGDEIRNNYIDFYPRPESELLISAIYGTNQRNKIYNPVYTPATTNDATVVVTGTITLPMGHYEIMCDQIRLMNPDNEQVILPGATLVLTDENGVALPRRFGVNPYHGWYDTTTSLVYDGLELTDHDGGYGARRVWIDGELVADGLGRDSVINRFTHPDFVFAPRDYWRRVDVAANAVSYTNPFGRIGRINNHNPSTRERNIHLTTTTIDIYKYEQTTSESPAYILEEPWAQSYFTFYVYYNGGEVRLNSPNNSSNSGVNAYLNPIKHIINRYSESGEWNGIPQVSIPSSPAIVRVGDFADHDAWAAVRGPGGTSSTAVTALDLEDGDVSNAVATVGTVDTGLPGSYDLTFFAGSSGENQSAGETITIEVLPANTEVEVVFGSEAGTNWGLNNNQGWSPTQRDKSVAHYYFNFQIIGPDWTKTIYNYGQAEGPDSLVQQTSFNDTMTADFLAGNPMSYRLNLGRFEPISGGDYDQASLEEIEHMTVKLTFKTPDGKLFDPVSNTIVSSTYDATPIHYSPGDTIEPKTSNPFKPYAIVGDLASFVDTDGDGYVDNDDAFPVNPYDWQDSNNDGIGDNLENTTPVVISLDYDKTRWHEWELIGSLPQWGHDYFNDYKTVYASGSYESIPHRYQWHLAHHGRAPAYDGAGNSLGHGSTHNIYDEETTDIRNFIVDTVKWLDGTPLYIYSIAHNQSNHEFHNEADNKYPDLHIDYGDGKVLLPQPGAVGQNNGRFYKLTRNSEGKVKIETSLADGDGTIGYLTPKTTGFSERIAVLEAGSHFQLLRDFDDDNDLTGNDIDTVPGDPNLAFSPTRQHRFTTYAHPDSGYVYKNLTSDRDGGYVQFSKYNKLSSDFDWSSQGNNGGHGWGPGDGTYNYTIAFEGYAHASSWWKYTEFDTAPDDTIYTFTLTSPDGWTAGSWTYLSIGNVNISADPENIYHLSGGMKSATNPDGFQIFQTLPSGHGDQHIDPITPPSGSNVNFTNYFAQPDGGVTKIQLKHAVDDKIYIRIAWGETEVYAQNLVESMEFIDSEVIDADLDYYPIPFDEFPDDPSEHVDTDEDGVGDNTDAFPLIPSLQQESPFSTEVVAQDETNTVLVTKGFANDPIFEWEWESIMPYNKSFHIANANPGDSNGHFEVDDDGNIILKSTF